MQSSLSDLPKDCQTLLVSFSLDALARLALSNRSIWAIRGAEALSRGMVLWKDRWKDRDEGCQAVERAVLSVVISLEPASVLQLPVDLRADKAATTVDSGCNTSEMRPSLKSWSRKRLPLRFTVVHGPHHSCCASVTCVPWMDRSTRGETLLVIGTPTVRRGRWPSPPHGQSLHCLHPSATSSRS